MVFNEYFMIELMNLSEYLSAAINDINTTLARDPKPMTLTKDFLLRVELIFCSFAGAVISSFFTR